MPIHAYSCGEHFLRVNRFFGAVTPGHLAGLADFYEARRDLLAHDLVNLIDENVQISGFTSEALTELRQRYRNIKLNADLILQRRSAWICPSIAAWRRLEIWLEGRHAHDGQGTEFCLVAQLDDADILFEPHELDAVRRWDGFSELIQIDV